METFTVVIIQKIAAIPPETIRIDNYRRIENEERYASHKIIKNNYNKIVLSLALSVEFKNKKHVFMFDLFWFLTISQIVNFFVISCNTYGMTLNNSNSNKVLNLKTIKNTFNKVTRIFS